MRSFFLTLKGNYQATFVIGGTLILAFASASFCSLFFDEHQLSDNTDLISTVYQVMGTIYAILLTFTLWGVWQNFTKADDSVQNEAFALLDLVHMLEISFANKNDTIRPAALAYATLVIEHEWQTLKSFTNEIINLREHDHSPAMQVIQAVQDTVPANEREGIIFAQALKLLARWLDARRERLLIARGNSAKSMWPLLFTGAFVLFAFHGLFVAKTVAIWITLLFGTALVIGVTFYLIFTLDCPFDGSLCIDSEPFSLAIDVLKKSNAKS